MAIQMFPRWGIGNAVVDESKARGRIRPTADSPPVNPVNPGGPMMPGGMTGAYNEHTGQIGPDNPHGPYPQMTGPYWHPTSRANWQHIFWGDW
jgi:hypothetical protein